MAPGTAARADRWCWVVAFAAFLVNFCLLGVHRSSSVMFVALLESFQVTRQAAAWPSGVFGFCMCVTGVAAGYLSHHLSIRSIMAAGSLLASLSVSLCCVASDLNHIVILYGAFQGAGIGVIVPLTHVILNRYFKCCRAVAMGIAYAGSSAGSFFFPPMAQWMLGKFGLHGTFLLLGGVMLQSMVGVALMRSPETAPTTRSANESPGGAVALVVGKPTDTSELPDKPSEELAGSTEDKVRLSCVITVEILTNLDFLLISAVFAVYFSISSIFLMVILDVSMEKMIVMEQGLFLVSAFSFGDLVGRLLCGWIGDVKCVKRSTTVCCYLLGMAAFLMAIPLCCSYELLCAISILLGLLNGGVIVNYSALLTELLGLRRLPIAMGFSSSIIGLTAFLRPLVIGYFRDRNNSYDYLFVTLGATQMLLTTTWLLKTAIKSFSEGAPTNDHASSAKCWKK